MSSVCCSSRIDCAPTEPMHVRMAPTRLSVPSSVNAGPKRICSSEPAMPTRIRVPRGTRIRVGIAGSLEQILFGPAFTEDGTLNLVGAIRTCMGSVGARNIRELQQTELIIAPAIKTEGKVFQQAQKLGRPR